jgi:hypothetical protein
MESATLQQLQQIPGLGKNIDQDSQNIESHSIDQLNGQNGRIKNK